MTTAALHRLLQPIAAPSHSARAHFRNWGQTFACKPLQVFEPETDYECKLILELARREQRSVRFAGVGHSPSDLACTTEYMLRTRRLNRVLEVRLLQLSLGPPGLPSGTRHNASGPFGVLLPLTGACMRSRY